MMPGRSAMINDTQPRPGLVILGNTGGHWGPASIICHTPGPGDIQSWGAMIVVVFVVFRVACGVGC